MRELWSQWPGLVGATATLCSGTIKTTVGDSMTRLAMAGALGLAAVVTLSACSGSGTAPTTSGTGQAAVTSIPTSSAMQAGEQELTIKSLELSGSLTPEQLSKTFIQDRLTAWNMAGSTESNLNKFYELGAPVSFPKEIAAKNSKTFKDALFVSDWQNSANLTKWGNSFEQVETGALTLNYITDYKNSSNVKDKERYQQGINIESTTVISQSADTVTVQSLATQFDNASRNSVADRQGSAASINGDKIAVTVTFKFVNNTWRVSEMDIASRN